MGGSRTAGFTTIVTCEKGGGQGGELTLQIARTSFALHRIKLVPVRQPISQVKSNMSVSAVERLVLCTRRRALTGSSIHGLSMPKACRKLVFEPTSDQNDRDEDAASEEQSDYRQENLQRQIERWGFDFRAGRPLPNGRLEWDAVPEERVASYYRETCLRSPPRRNLRSRRNIMSARTSESSEHHSAENPTVGDGHTNASRFLPATDQEGVSRVSGRSETETASVAVSTSSSTAHNSEIEGASNSNSNNHGCNNGLLNSSPSTSVAKMTQSNIADFFNQRKRRRSLSEGNGAKRARTQDHLDRPQSAPAVTS
ncbi:uncharacterized protein LOC129283426 [Lytechinus pictus]|uniref:uncharacterized protein LOC129283426 n=1 Tax=Lytechinus pictus TaxID=7653 RepID=UPI0030B9E274